MGRTQLPRGVGRAGFLDLGAGRLMAMTSAPASSGTAVGAGVGSGSTLGSGAMVFGAVALGAGLVVSTSSRPLGVSNRVEAKKVRTQSVAAALHRRKLRRTTESGAPLPTMTAVMRIEQATTTAPAVPMARANDVPVAAPT